MLHYTNGRPLAIKILGSFLFTLHISQWRNVLIRLRESPNKDIIDVLMSKYQYPLQPPMYQYNGRRSCHGQTSCAVKDQSGGDHHNMEQKYIQGYHVQPSLLSNLYPFGPGFNYRSLMFNDEGGSLCSIMWAGFSFEFTFTKYYIEVL
jgi:hypothetical protein